MRYLITGGTGSFGQAMTRHLLNGSADHVVIYSRDEWKQAQMAATFADPRLRFHLGDIRDGRRLRIAVRDVDVVIHAAALKRVDALEYNPTEAIETNVVGGMRVAEACLFSDVKKVVCLSTDKAVNPVNLYGATKLTMEKTMLAYNGYTGRRDHPRFSCVRYGNVMGSRGSVVPIWREALAQGRKLAVTDLRMTRFWFTLREAVRLVEWTLARMQGGEVVVPRMPSFKVMDLAAAMNGGKAVDISGIRPGEKLHETMIGSDEARHARPQGNYVILDPHQAGLHGEAYASDTNSVWLDIPALRQRLEDV